MNLKYTPFILLLFLLVLPTVTSASEHHDKLNILVITDMHVNQHTHHTMEINPPHRNFQNDLDLQTFERLMSETKQAIKQGAIKKPSMVMILGDIQGHLRTSHHAIIENEATVFRVFSATFPDTPIFYTFGNNDSLQSNYGPFKLKNNKKPHTSEKSPFDVAVKQDGWKDGFLSTGALCKKTESTYPCLISEDKKHGYYSAYLEPNLRFISLNSVLFSVKRKHVSKHEANMQLHWLETQLKTATTEQDAVLLAMHIPPGRNVYNHEAFWEAHELTTFLNLINTYQNSIIGILTAHTHYEGLKLIQNKTHTNISTVYSTAALSTSHGNAPSVKTFELSNTHHYWTLDDYETFSFSDPESKLQLNSLYRYSDYYGDSKPITAERMRPYFSAGNKNFSGIMKSPEDMIITLAEQKSYQTPSP
jgi:sphingomyelin phosphodiesterase acid-like 3